MTIKAERVAKLIANAGLCSRREAEAWIAQGRVMLDGEMLTSSAVTVDNPSRLKVDGKPLPTPQLVRLWLYHKPPGLLTTHKDPEGRPTIFEQLPKNLPRVVSIGRLDMNSEGLLLLTTSGEFARKLELPANGFTRTYRVRVFGRLDQAQLQRLSRGITLDGVRYRSIKVHVESHVSLNAWLRFELIEGKNREIRRVIAHMDLKISRLIRVGYGPFQLEDLEPGAVREVPWSRIKKLLAPKSYGLPAVL